MPKNVHEAVEGYNLTLEKEVLIEYAAGIQAKYFRYLMKNDIYIKSDNDFAKKAVSLSELSNKILLAENFETVHSIEEEINSLKALI